MDGNDAMCWGVIVLIIVCFTFLAYTRYTLGI
jgi:hypothetical protein